MSDSAPIPILVLTEDSGQYGFATLQAIVRRILEKIAPDAPLDNIELEPTENVDALRSMRGNDWMGQTGEANHFRTTLIQTIATTNFPFEFAVAAGKSLKHVVTLFETCTDLRAALMRVTKA